MKIIVSLTTIPTRVPFLEPVIQSIQEQSLIPDAIELNLPKEYSKRSLGIVDPSTLPKGVNIYWMEKDLGPASKVLPTAKRYRKCLDTVIVYCDDDKLYDRDWLKRLVEKAKLYPNACIVESGWNIYSHLHKKYWRKRPVLYKLLRLLSLGRFKAGRAGDDSIQIAEGWSGVLIRPDFFDDRAFVIPDVIWSVDDVWLSGWLAINNHPILSTNESRDKLSRSLVIDGKSIGELSSLYKFVYKGFDRSQSDALCIEYMRSKYQIWK